MKHLVNISVDDVSPHPYSSIKVIKSCFKIISEFPYAKFTFFVPTAYWRTVSKPPISYNENPLYLSENKKFCDYLKRLPPQNFEIGYHGHHHGIEGITNNDEFKTLNYEEADTKIKLMLEEVNKAGLTNLFKSYFRPPAWRLSPASFDALKDNGIEILALSQEQRMKDIYAGKDEKHDKVVYYNVNPPYMPLELYKKTEIVYHACEWDRNYFSSQLADDLLSFLHTNRNKIKFATLAEMIDGQK